MYENIYKKLSAWFRKSKSKMKTITVLHDILPLIMYISYPLLLISLIIYKNPLFLKAIIVPAVVFLSVSIIRIIIDAKRPYELYDIEPLIKKETHGKSFPSRHTASAFIIAMLFLRYQLNLGVLMLIVAFLIALIRIISGAHFVKDVIAGALISIIIGVVFFFII